MFNYRSKSVKSLIASAAFVAAGVLWTASPSHAALTGYGTVVNADGPFESYRFEETGITTSTQAVDNSGNGHTGTYFLSPQGGFTTPNGGDAAVSFNGTTQYLLANAGTSSLGFGSAVNTSSYEFIFRTNPGFNTNTSQSLFGVFNSGASNFMALSVDLNTAANGQNGANNTRIFIRDNNNDSVGASFNNSTAYDGKYHHLVFTFDGNQAGVNAFNAYLDGNRQPLTFATISNGAADADFDPDVFVPFNVAPEFAGQNGAGNTLINLANITLDEAAIYPTVLNQVQVSAHAALPEPATAGLGAVVGLGLLARRRRKLS